MKTDKNRTFYFIETVDNNGGQIIKVGSDDSPLWGKTFTSLNDAVEAVKRRNSSASDFKPILNGLIAVYEPESCDGDNL